MTLRGSDILGEVNSSGRRTLKGLLISSLSKYLSKRANQVIAVSRVIANKISRDDVHIIPSPVDFKIFTHIPRDQARDCLCWPKQRMIVLFAALNVNNKRKRFDLAKKAIALIKEELPVELRIATGVSPEQMPLYMNAADVLLLTSIHEGSPNVVKEAMACNMPIVTTDVGDVRERLDNIKQCAICEANPDALAKALKQILKNGCRSNGRQSIIQLEKGKNADQVISVYKKVLENS
jgi:glycosyltransferase involved in cell wall biosynthesis